MWYTFSIDKSSYNRGMKIFSLPRNELKALILNPLALPRHIVTFTISVHLKFPDRFLKLIVPFAQQQSLVTVNLFTEMLLAFVARPVQSSSKDCSGRVCAEQFVS